MNNRPGILLTKPVALINRNIQVDGRSLFIGMLKALANAATGNLGNVPENIIDIGAALGLTQEPGEIAWLLIFSALTQAMVNLVEDNKDLVQLANLGNKVKQDDLQIISENRLNQCLEKLEQGEITIYHDFFERPQDFAVIAEIKTPFAQWLQTEFNLKPAPAEAISNRLPYEFIDALYAESAKHPDKYAKLQTELDNLFSKPAEQKAKQELSWRRYSAWLQKQVEERMFDEAFGLRQVYVPLRAYYEEKIESQDDHYSDSSSRNHQREDNKVKRIVVKLEEELQTWLEQADKSDAIRIISGGPGSGKSSFAKIFAATQAEKVKGKIPVLFIQLDLFDPEADLVEAIGKFIESMRDIPLPPNPLKKENFVDRLLIIFDGLDELAKQGKIAEGVAQSFISEVRRQVDSFNAVQTRLLVLISGREIVVQKNQSEFRKSKQVLNVIPYFIDQQQIKDNNYIDVNKLLETDQRQIWWQNYGQASGLGYSELPTELDQGNLREITAQPLLNYLVALSYESKEVNFTENSNLNEIYAHLLTKVYQRAWGNNQNPHIKGIEEKDFIRMLEGIAIAAWHGGDIRVTTVSEIENYCDSHIIDRILKIFKEDKRASFTRLLTAFYFRQRGVKNREETFEFTHKSFGEYLAAREIVRQLNLIHQELKRKEDSDIGLDKKQALEWWAKICGLTAMDKYIFEFVVNEIRLQQDKYKVDVGAWQQTLCNLISYMLKQGMPMERLGIGTFQEANRQARNAEEALLAVLNACARLTNKVSEIKWHSPEAFGVWISRLHGQRVNYANEVFCLNCLSFLDLQNCNLIGKDFDHVNLERANLVEVQLAWADLQQAYLVRADLGGAYLVRADLGGADLEGANLVGANLVRAYLVGANLEGAYLVGVNLEGADLEGVNLVGANLVGANLVGANLEGANLVEANLVGVNLVGVNLVGADVEWPKLLPDHFEPEEADSSDNPPQP
ncbi:putative low-complexity protein [Cylindrospermum stagnale PCC 7417]|uniref:Putative low-complexity protein n=1 Tax=Cylindrospermum stagnale PCC 7417 TaxID=56107 RepID=K9X520_9NOST|nr:pentapeptide repeat-containing protein [Cylindrospermum stagnale]AFZ27151.1 putative low-complexity protein [Cylindrospermum stagnale PCC 7417]